ncbi:hypothetical protein SAMN05192584_13430 [Streptomyces pini]|uniref:Uncharacterized protein n=1 Tax=Streptomyces pini TaxID=1520580 RepID=A0A1I4M008_9ACTN|nr:hypothetical protein SAMN05192584_13430 [Streptomyces pini]
MHRPVHADRPGRKPPNATCSGVGAGKDAECPRLTRQRCQGVGTQGHLGHW